MQSVTGLVCVKCGSSFPALNVIPIIGGVCNECYGKNKAEVELAKQMQAEADRQVVEKVAAVKEDARKAQERALEVSNQMHENEIYGLRKEFQELEGEYVAKIRELKKTGKRKSATAHDEMQEAQIVLSVSGQTFSFPLSQARTIYEKLGEIFLPSSSKK